MKQSDEQRIADLERRVKELEARPMPIYYPVYVPPYEAPTYQTQYPVYPHYYPNTVGGNYQ